MNTVYPEMEDRYVLEAFCIENGSVAFFDLGKEPIVRESFMLGSAKIGGKRVSYYRCMYSMWKVRTYCPQKCITEYVVGLYRKKGFLFESIMGAFRDFSGCYCDSCFIRWHSRNPDQ